MRPLPHYITELSAGRLFRLICVGLFFFIQTMTLSHAAEHGDHHHHHEHENEAVACSISLIAPEIDAVLPPTAIMPVPQTFKVPADFTPISTQRHSYHECRGPPGRAPPAFSL